MKALTIQQPWAWTVVAGVKPIENRTWASKHRGVVAVHAGNRLSERGLAEVPRLVEKSGYRGLMPETGDMAFGALIGTAFLVDTHDAMTGCCESPWAEEQYVEHGGRVRKQIVHWVLEDAVEFAMPIRCRGALGLWTVPNDIEALVMEAPRL